MAKTAENQENKGSQEESKNIPAAPTKETPEQIIARLTAENSKLTAERDAHKELAEETTGKLKKLESVQTEPTVDLGDDTFKIVLKKVKLRTKKEALAKSFQLVKNADGSVDEGYAYPDEDEWKELIDTKENPKGILIKL